MKEPVGRRSKSYDQPAGKRFKSSGAPAGKRQKSSEEPAWKRPGSNQGPSAKRLVSSRDSGTKPRPGSFEGPPGRPPESGRGPAGRRAEAVQAPADNILAGINPVREALKSGRPVDKVLLVPGDKSPRTGEIMALARDRGVPVQKLDRAVLDNISGDSRHQGVLAYIAAREYSTVEDILAGAGESPLLLLLDEINDPHNLGAILRTAEAAGVSGVVIPRHRSVSLTPTVAKVSAGAVEYVPVARVANMVQTIDMLKERGLWVVGADAEGPELHWKARLDGPLALVVGGEDKGLGRLVREKCDLIVRLPMRGRMNSLNASVAAAVLLYEVLRQRSRD